MANDKATVTLYSGKTVTTNSSTVFVVYNDTSDDYTVYTGIKNAPSIDGTASAVESYAYCKSGKMATIMFVFVQNGSAIEDDSNSTLFLAKESVSNLIHDKDGRLLRVSGHRQRRGSDCQGRREPGQEPQRYVQELLR